MGPTTLFSKPPCCFHPEGSPGPLPIGLSGGTQPCHALGPWATPAASVLVLLTQRRPPGKRGELSSEGTPRTDSAAPTGAGLFTNTAGLQKLADIIQVGTESRQQVAPLLPDGRWRLPSVGCWRQGQLPQHMLQVSSTVWGSSHSGHLLQALRMGPGGQWVPRIFRQAWPAVGSSRFLLTQLFRGKLMISGSQSRGGRGALCALCPVIDGPASPRGCPVMDEVSVSR